MFEENLEKYNQLVIECIKKYSLNKELMIERKKSEELLEKEEEAKKNQQKKEETEVIKKPGDNQSMDDEGSQLSDNDSLMDNDDLKLY